MIRARPWVVGVVASGALLFPAAALAHLAYVDKDTGSGSACEQADPCATIAAGITAVEPGLAVVVDDSATPYEESVSLEDGKSLIAQDFVGGSEAQSTIDGEAAAAVEVLPGGAGAISGFSLRSDANAVLAQGAVSVTGNTFDDPQQVVSGDVQVLTSAAVSISSNDFTDADSLSADTAIRIAGGASPLVSGNEISGYDRAIEITGAGTQPQITQNTITGGHGPGTGTVLIGGDAATPTVSGNELAMPNGDAIGVRVLEDTTTVAPTSASLNRNTVTGYPTAVVIEDTTGSVTLTGDLLVANTGTGLTLADTPPTGLGQGDVSATNVTFANNASGDISNLDAELILDSTIVEDPISAGGGATCVISFSRGPTTNGTSCQQFQTTAAPGFVDAANDDYDLASGSAMIDAGNPVSPGQGAIDLDGDPREGDGDCNGQPRRDIGADELVSSCPQPPPPDAGDTAPPDTVLDSGPSSKTRSKAASFAFHSTEPGSSFECKLDAGPFAPCASPRAYEKLGRGLHSFEVRAMDAAGNVDSSPASRTWTVKKKRKKQR